MPALIKSRLLLPKAYRESRRRYLTDARFPHIWVPKIIPAHASVGFDTSGFHDSGSSSVSTLSNNFTIGASLSNGGMVGAFATGGATQATSITMTWNAVSMALIASTTIFDAGVGTLALFGLVNPAGGTHSLSASWTNAQTASIGFWTFTGVDQTGGATTFKHGNTHDNGGGGSSATLSITTVSGNGTVALWGAGQAFSGTQTPTADWQDNISGDAINEGQHILSVSSSSAFTAAMGATDTLIGSGCDILAAAGGAATPVLGLPRRIFVRRRWSGWRQSPFGAFPKRPRPALWTPRKHIIRAA